MQDHEKATIRKMFPDAVRICYLPGMATTSVFDERGNHSKGFNSIGGNPFNLEPNKSVSLLRKHEQFENTYIPDADTPEKWAQVCEYFGSSRGYHTQRAISWNNLYTKSHTFGIAHETFYTDRGLVRFPYKEFVQKAGLPDLSKTKTTHEDIIRMMGVKVVFRLKLSGAVCTDWNSHYDLKDFQYCDNIPATGSFDEWDWKEVSI